MKGGKVYPTPAVTSSVDQLTSQIDRDIQLITSSLDRTANSYGNSKNSGGDRNRNDSNNVRLYTAPGSEDSRNDYNYGQTNSSATAANGYHGTGNVGRTVSNEDDEEEVKLSHQLAKKDNIVTKELEENFTKILQQLNEYKKRYNNAVVANKRIEEKLIANNEKIELLADENSKLKQDSLIMKPNAINRNNLDRTNGIGNKKDELYYRSEQIRKALLSDENEDETAITFDSLLKTYGVKDAIIHYLSVFAPFRRDIRTVQARFGTGVASYFIFYRFLFLQFIVLAIVAIIFGILHLYSLITRTDSPNDYLVSESYIPYFMSYSSYDRSEALAYSMMIFILLLINFLIIIITLVYEDFRTKSVSAIEAANEFPFAKAVLCCWDNSVTTQIEVDEYSSNINNSLSLLLEVAQSTGEKESRSNFDIFVVSLRRTAGFILYASLQVVAAAMIISLTIYSASISKSVSNVNGLKSFASLITPFILAVINGATPTLIRYITLIEKWDSGQWEQTYMLIRVYISSTLNIIILAYSYLLLVDPFLFGKKSLSYLRTNVELQRNDNFDCRIEQAANGLFTLVLFSWALREVNMLLIPFGQMQLTKIFSKNKECIKSEFKVTENMVQTLNFLGLLFLSMPFAPLTIVFSPIYVLISFKWQKYVIKRFYTKPKRPWKSNYAGLVYCSFYFITFLLVGVSVSSYFMTAKTLAKSCTIQDDYVNLCVDTVDTTTNLCTVDTASEYYNLYGKNNDYPKNICGDSCGPFVDRRSGFSVLRDRIENVIGLNVLFELLFEYPYVPWLIIIILFILFVINGNTMEVMKINSYEKERAMIAHIQTIEIERKKQESTIQKLKTIEEETDDDTENF